MLQQCLSLRFAYLLQVLQGLRMRVIPDMPALVLTEPQQLHGVSEQSVPQDFAQYKESILCTAADLKKAVASPAGTPAPEVHKTS